MYKVKTCGAFYAEGEGAIDGSVWAFVVARYRALELFSQLGEMLDSWGAVVGIRWGRRSSGHSLYRVPVGELIM